MISGYFVRRFRGFFLLSHSAHLRSRPNPIMMSDFNNNNDTMWMEFDLDSATKKKQSLSTNQSKDLTTDNEDEFWAGIDLECKVKKARQSNVTSTCVIPTYEDDEAWATFDLEAIEEICRRRMKPPAPNVEVSVTELRPVQRQLCFSSSPAPLQSLQTTRCLTTPLTSHQSRRSISTDTRTTVNDTLLLFPEHEVSAVMQRYFSFDRFRPGQLEVVQAALAGRDASVLWATGKGKSLCYILPALVSKKTSIVVSPLISLMTDQVTNLNNTVGSVENREVACFVNNQGGPGQQTCAEAFSGRYSIVYLTPEMLPSCLNAISALHLRGGGGGVCLLAVDEAHCISQWGQDFREAFLTIKCFRDTPVLACIPLMALTATAVPRVQADIKNSLNMHPNCLDSVTSVDRVNLAISVRHQRQGGLSENFRFMEDLFRGANGRAGSTIVYVPTTNGVENVAAHLAAVLPASVRVVSYHGKQGMEARRCAHLAFLTGEAQVIVATIAFGMGIDKPDIRRIVHYGAPKSMEEYYQHIGRAGRDGLPSQCVLLYSESDLNQYNSDFYMKGLTPQAREQYLRSLDIMRSYANAATTTVNTFAPSGGNNTAGMADGVNCRRVFILRYFNESPSYERCGTCDTCLARGQYVGDQERDFGLEVGAVLAALQYPCGQGHSAIQLATKILGPGVVGSGANFMRTAGCSTRTKKLILDKYSYATDAKAVLVQIIGKLTQPQGDGDPLLHQKSMSTKTASGYCCTWTIFEVHPAASATAAAMTARLLSMEADPTLTALPYMLPVPDAVRERDAKDEAEREMVVQEFADLQKQLGGVSGGFSLHLSEDEMVAKGGPILRWLRMLKRTREVGREELATRKEQLLQRICDWRQSTALKYGMSPEAVLKTDVAMQIAMLQISDVHNLQQAGVRITGVETLAGVIQQALLDLRLVQESANEGAEMIIDSAWRPAGPWQHATTGTMSAGAKRKTLRAPYWEDSWQQHCGGRATLQSIAMLKNLQPATILKHVLVALTAGQAVDLDAVKQQARQQEGGVLDLPNSVEWESLERAEAAGGFDVCALAKVEDWQWGAHIPAVEDIVLMAYHERSDAQNLELSKWRNKFLWWSSLKRVKYPVKFAEIMISV